MATNYNLFIKFIESFENKGFLNIDRQDSQVKDLETVLEKNRQFFYIADLIRMKILFTSYSVCNLLGVDPEDVDPYLIFDITHPDDIERHSSVRARLIQCGNDLFVKNNKYMVMSTNFRFRDDKKNYINFLNQAYIWSSLKPKHTVYCVIVVTDISWFRNINHGYNSFSGTDLSYFRYPDENLIMTGCAFTDREFEIIRLVEQGLTSENISEKIFISRHTVNTHRRNILKKTGMTTLSELVHDLKERGLL